MFPRQNQEIDGGCEMRDNSRLTLGPLSRVCERMELAFPEGRDIVGGAV